MKLTFLALNVEAAKYAFSLSLSLSLSLFLSPSFFFFFFFFLSLVVFVVISQFSSCGSTSQPGRRGAAVLLSIAGCYAILVLYQTIT